MKLLQRLVYLTRRMPLVSWTIGTALVVRIAFSVLVGMVPLVVVVLPFFVAVMAVAFNRLVNRAETSGKRQGVALLSMFAATVVVFGLIQLVPYGRDHTNPPELAEPEWSSADTRELMVRACFGCHSNEVECPSYDKVAPLSWAIQAHIDAGRSEVNYSEFGHSRENYDETVEVILDGSMPPRYYTRFGLHPEAKLTDAEVMRLVEGLRKTPGLDEHEERGEKYDHGGDDD